MKKADDSSKKINSPITAAVAVAAASAILLSGCSQAVRNPSYSLDSQDSSRQEVTASEPSVSQDKNVPSNLVTHSQPSSDNEGSGTPSATLPSVPEHTGEQIKPSTQDPEVSQAPEIQPPVTGEGSSQTNSSGEIIDDYRSDLVFPETDDPDELYELFGLSRSERSAYYESISKECGYPIIHVSTENEMEVLSRDDYVNCIVEIFNCEDEYVMDAASAGIRVRGNASAFYGDVDKLREEGAPYRIKFNHKTSVLGLNDNARCKSWVLLKTYNTGVRDRLAFELAEAINEGKYYSSDSRFVHVYMNEEYMGIYLLCEQSQENPNRVAINECEEGYTGTDIGYFVELDNYSYESEWRFMLNYNKESITDCYGTSRVPRKYYYTIRNDIYSEEQESFIERYFEVAYEIPMRAIKYGEYYRLNDDFTLTLANEEFSSAEECVSQVLDIESFVDMYITYEIVNDQDVGGGSFFFAVDFGSVSQYKTLTCVCPWDFSWAYTDYNAESDGGLYAARFKDSYFVENWGDRSNPWLILLYSADWFKELVMEKWQERYPAILEALANERENVNSHTQDFNKDGVRRSSRAIATLDWVDSRVEYLNSLWG